MHIETTGLSKRYRSSEREFWAVHNVSLSVDAGEIYGLLGPNGSGKSTFVQMLVTMLAPTSGSATIGGHDVVHDPRTVRSVIGVTLQDVGVDPVLTPIELLIAQGLLSGLGRSAARSRAAELIDLVGLPKKARDRTGALSGGQRRRLDLALSLVHRPSILFLDEPTTGLDPAARRDLWTEIGRLRTEGTTILLTTQYLEEADQLADRIGVLAGGRLIEEGTPHELKARHGRPSVEITVDDLDLTSELLRTRAIGDWVIETTDPRRSELVISVEDTESDLARIVSGLATAGITVTKAIAHTPTLDDVFFEITGSPSARAEEVAA